MAWSDPIKKWIADAKRSELAAMEFFGAAVDEQKAQASAEEGIEFMIQVAGVEAVEEAARSSDRSVP